MTKRVLGSAPVPRLRVSRPPRRTALWPLAWTILALASVAHAADLPISGTYGTLAMCVIDAFMDIPPGDVNFNAGGAPLAQVLPGEFDTARESCVFQKLVSKTESELKSTWVVDADCSGAAGATTRVLTIVNDKEARSITVSDQTGTLLSALDQCSLSYAERLSREAKRMPPASKK